MLVNAAAFLFVLGLIGAGLWLADTMAELRQNQDCVLSGRRDCMPVEVDKQPLLTAHNRGRPGRKAVFPC